MPFILGTIASSRKGASSYFMYASDVDYQGHKQLVGMPNGHVAFAGYRGSRNFIAKLVPSSASIAWELDNASGTEGYSRGIAVDSSNNLYYPLAQGGINSQVWLTQVTNTGSIGWTRRLAGNNDVQWTGATIDGTNIILYGLSNGYGNANYDCMYYRYNTSGGYTAAGYIRHPNSNSTWWAYNGADYSSSINFRFFKPTGSSLSGWSSQNSYLCRVSNTTGDLDQAYVYGTNNATARSSEQVWSDSSAVYVDLFNTAAPIDYTLLQTNSASTIYWQKKYTTSLTGNLYLAIKGAWSNGTHTYTSGYLSSPGGGGSQSGIYAKINNSNGNVVWVRRIRESGDNQTIQPAQVWADATNVYMAIRINTPTGSVGGVMVLNENNPPSTMSLNGATYNFDDITSTITATNTSHTGTAISATSASQTLTNTTQTLGTSSTVTFTKKDF